MKSPKSKWYHKAGAAASIASNFIPGAGAVKWGIKAVKYGKKMKKAKNSLQYPLRKRGKANYNPSDTHKHGVISRLVIENQHLGRGLLDLLNQLQEII
ncbi:hypothetical protein JS44_11585 [Anoxybacillus flavithermus]|uniref:Uncharacterized protein n=1 Tax=Anoxybacillus flavithermus TaxID=33934 RepID=A0A094JIF7_9BACL|nr:hypothetical protein JS44_11585 [Anoxybacillus flavithermus]